MGVFKWLRRERLTVTRKVSPAPATPDNGNPMNTIGTIRTEEYKQHLAEFTARRSSGQQDVLDTPKKSRCGAPPLSVSCTHCATNSPDKTFSYEKKSATKYKKSKQRNPQSSNKSYEAVPNVQFLFQGQVFLPGNIYPGPHSDFVRGKQSRRRILSNVASDSPVERRLEYTDDEDIMSPPLFYKDNPLPCNAKTFLTSHKTDQISVEKIDISSDSDEVNSRDKLGSCEDKLKEVLCELKNLDQWADEQLQGQSLNSSRTEGNKSDSSIYGLPLVSVSNLDLTVEKTKSWNTAQWGVVPVRIRKLAGVTIDHVRTKQNSEIEILKKCRHPNIVLLMGVFPDIHRDLHLICEHFMDSLFDILHVQGPIFTVQNSIDYASDITSALVFLHMQGYVHTDLSSHKVVITKHNTAKLADLSSCVKYQSKKRNKKKSCDIYSPEPHYVNIDATPRSGYTESQPLISKNSSEIYLTNNAVTKPYNLYENSAHYRWQAPELYQPECDLVRPCSKSDVYSLSLIIWECCNAAIPWKSLSYDKLKELYVVWQTGIRLPQDGTYPGSLLELLQDGLKLDRSERADLKTISERLQVVKNSLKDLPDIILPAKLSKRLSAFSTTICDSTSPSDILSPPTNGLNIEQAAQNSNGSSIESDKETGDSIEDGLYEVIREEQIVEQVEKCYISDDDSDFENIPKMRYNKLLIEENYPSSACSTPISKTNNRVKTIGTPGASLHRSDSTEYCSIFSPNRTVNFGRNESSLAEKSTIKLSRSFTPKNYKPLHIKVPEFSNLDGIRSMRKDRNDGSAKCSFDIKNYSLPNTPIARSNKLRKNAWLSGEIDDTRDISVAQNKAQEKLDESRDVSPETIEADKQSPKTGSSGSTATVPDTYNSHRKQDSSQDDSPVLESNVPDRFQWYKSMERSQSVKARIDDDVLATMSVKPLVAIHEKWIYEANKKPGRSMSLPEDRRPSVLLKPASHAAALQSAPQLTRSRRNSRGSEQFSQARDLIAKSLTSSSRELSSEQRFWKNGSSDSKSSKSQSTSEIKIDQATDTVSIEEFIKQLIRTEFEQLKDNFNNEGILDKGTANVLEALKTSDINPNDNKKEKTFSRIKINGNNKPLLQISFARNGTNSLQVLDDCVNVTICDGNAKVDGFNQSFDDGDNFQDNSLRRCQGFNALQEARSTEDLYIDDDISTQVQENFGGKVKLIPLHGSLHEILCEKQDDCCLIKVKQENGCDTIYFRCDHSTDRDQIDGQDTLLYTRSISLVEERIQRVPKKLKKRPKSEPTAININFNKDTKILSNSTPSLVKDCEAIEVNLENALSYQDSSSEECLKCQTDCEEFERIEKKIEEDVAHTNTLGFSHCGCLEKISEENISVIEDFNDKDSSEIVENENYR